jgi:hypothetical protein
MKKMPETFAFATYTVADPQHVWRLLADLESWSKCSFVYENLHWEGEPWVCGSVIRGRISFPHALEFRYDLRAVQPATLIRYLASSPAASFATERTIQLQTLAGGTCINVHALEIEHPEFAIVGGSLGFSKLLTERWFREFAAFCDSESLRLRPTSPKVL